MSSIDPTWRRHHDQLRLRVYSIEDTEPGDNLNLCYIYVLKLIIRLQVKINQITIPR